MYVQEEADSYAEQMNEFLVDLNSIEAPPAKRRNTRGTGADTDQQLRMRWDSLRWFLNSDPVLAACNSKYMKQPIKTLTWCLADMFDQHQWLLEDKLHVE